MLHFHLRFHADRLETKTSPNRLEATSGSSSAHQPRGSSEELKPHQTLPSDQLSCSVGEIAGLKPWLRTADTTGARRSHARSFQPQEERGEPRVGAVRSPSAASFHAAQDDGDQLRATVYRCHGDRHHGPFSGHVCSVLLASETFAVLRLSGPGKTRWAAGLPGGDVEALLPPPPPQHRREPPP